MTTPYDNNFPAAPLEVRLPGAQDGALPAASWSSDTAPGASLAVA